MHGDTPGTGARERSVKSGQSLLLRPRSLCLSPYPPCWHSKLCPLCLSLSRPQYKRTQNTQWPTEGKSWILCVSTDPFLGVRAHARASTHTHVCEKRVLIHVLKHLYLCRAVCVCVDAGTIYSWSDVGTGLRTRECCNDSRHSHGSVLGVSLWRSAGDMRVIVRRMCTHHHTPHPATLASISSVGLPCYQWRGLTAAAIFPARKHDVSQWRLGCAAGKQQWVRRIGALGLPGRTCAPASSVQFAGTQCPRTVVGASATVGPPSTTGASTGVGTNSSANSSATGSGSRSERP